MADEIELDTSGADRLLSQVDRRLARTRPLLEQQLKALEDASKAQFRSGQGWRPLSARYAARKRAEGFGTKKLQRTGGLLRSLTRRTAPGAVVTFGRDSVTRGTNLRQAAFLRRGTSSMPARDPLARDQGRLMKTLTEQSTNYLTEG